MLNGFGAADAIEALRKELGAGGVRVTYNAADMSKPAEIAGMVEAATRELGRVDILVNNAGIQFTAPVEEFPVERWDAIIAINQSAVFHDGENRDGRQDRENLLGNRRVDRHRRYTRPAVRVAEEPPSPCVSGTRASARSSGNT